MLVAGMGDQNTSDIATRIHENVLDFAGLFPESERLSYRKLVPKGRVWTGVYIDDWLCVYFCRRSETRQPGPDTTRDCEASARYLQAGLAEETPKSFHQNLSFRAWGALDEGGWGRVGAPPEVRLQICRVTVSVISLGWSNKRILQQLLGLYASCFIFRREFFSLFHHVFFLLLSFWRDYGHVYPALYRMNFAEPPFTSY